MNDLSVLSGPKHLVTVNVLISAPPSYWAWHRHVISSVLPTPPPRPPLLLARMAACQCSQVLGARPELTSHLTKRVPVSPPFSVRQTEEQRGWTRPKLHKTGRAFCRFIIGNVAGNGSCLFTKMKCEEQPSLPDSRWALPNPVAGVNNNSIRVYEAHPYPSW